MEQHEQDNETKILIKKHQCKQEVVDMLQGKIPQESEAIEALLTAHNSLKNATDDSANLTNVQIMNLPQPEKAEVCLQVAKGIIAKQRKVLNKLRLKNWRIVKRINTLENVVETLQNNDIYSKEAQDAIKLYQSLSKSYGGGKNDD